MKKIDECVYNCSMGKPQKRQTDTMKDCLKKKGLDVRQSRRMHGAQNKMCHKDIKLIVCQKSSSL